MLMCVQGWIFTIQITLAVKPELGRWEGGSESFSSQVLAAFPFRIPALWEIRSGTQLSSTGKLTKRKKEKKKNQVQWARGGSSPRLGRSTMKFPSEEQIPAGANFCGRWVFNSSVTLLFPPSYLLVSKCIATRVQDLSLSRMSQRPPSKTKLTHHPHSHACLFYKELGNRHPHLISRAPWKWRSWAQHHALALSHTSSLI